MFSGFIEERGRGISTWIRFFGACFLLEGVETCFRDEVLAKWHKSWEEGGRKFKLEWHLDGGGGSCFIQL